MKEQRRRTTADGSANSCAFVARRWSVVCRANAVIPATSGKIHHQDAKTPREDSQGGRGGQGEKIHHKGTKDTKEEMLRKKLLGIKPAVVCVVRGHKGKILTTEITEVTKGTEGKG
jgi:hypothetical protein